MCSGKSINKVVIPVPGASLSPYSVAQCPRNLRHFFPALWHHRDVICDTLKFSGVFPLLFGEFITKHTDLGKHTTYETGVLGKFYAGSC